jgi:hypothetical protein
MATGSSALLSDFVTGLHLAAWGQVLSALSLVALCHVLTILVFCYAVSPRSEPAGATAAAGQGN